MPDAFSVNAVGRSACSPVMSRLRTVPLTLPRTVSGRLGHARTNSSGIPPAKRIMSCLPIEASSRTLIRPGLAASIALKSMAASALRSESGVRTLSDGRLMRTESMATGPLRSASCRPLFSFIRQWRTASLMSGPWYSMESSPMFTSERAMWPGSRPSVRGARLSS